MNVSFAPAANESSPEELDCPTKDLRITTEESDTPLFSSFFSVLIVFFCSLRRSTFLFWSRRDALLLTKDTEDTSLVTSALKSKVCPLIESTLLSSNAPFEPEGIEIISPTSSSVPKSVWKPLTASLSPLRIVLSPAIVVFVSRTTSDVK